MKFYDAVTWNWPGWLCARRVPVPRSGVGSANTCHNASGARGAGRAQCPSLKEGAACWRPSCAVARGVSHSAHCPGVRRGLRRESLPLGGGRPWSLLWHCCPALGDSHSHFASWLWLLSFCCLRLNFRRNYALNPDPEGAVCGVGPAQDGGLRGAGLEPPVSQREAETGLKETLFWIVLSRFLEPVHLHKI